MRFSACAIALGLGALATPCLALTIQAAPPRPDVAQHLQSTTTSGFAAVLPSPDDLKSSFAASGRPQLGQGFYGAPRGGTTSMNFGPLHTTTTLAPGYGGGSWYDRSPRDSSNPLSLTPPSH